MTDRHEVVVVGGGLAGLAAARELHGLDVLLLEASDRIGGRVRSLRSGPYWLNLGAHILEGPGSLTRQLAAEFGLPITTPAGKFVAVALNGRVVKASRPEELPFRLPLSIGARASLIRAGIRLRLAHRRVTRADDGRILQSADPAAFETLPVDPGLDAISFSDFIGRLHPDVEAMMRTSVNRSGGEPGETSAHYAIKGLFGGFSYRHANLVGGTERLVEALAGTTAAVMRTEARVTSVTETSSGVRVEYRTPAGPETAEAAAAVIAVPSDIVLQVAPGLPEWKRKAIAAVHYSPFVVAGIFTTETGPMPWDDIYAMAAPKQAFSMFFNPGNALRTSSERQAGGALVVYVGSDRARAMLPMSHQEVQDRFIADLTKVFPGVRDVIGQVAVAQWEFGAPTPGPGRSSIQQALVAPVGRISFAGDYLRYAGIDYAMRSGQRAAGSARTWIDGTASAPAVRIT